MNKPATHQDSGYSQYCACQIPRSQLPGAHDDFVDKLTKQASAAEAGDPLDPKTMVGPLVSKEQFDRVKGYLDVGKKEGAEPKLGEKGKGYFVDPTVFTNVKNDMRIAREVIFGQVASVIPLKDENDALLQGNDSTDEHNRRLNQRCQPCSQGCTSIEGRDGVAQLL